jgi:hypothetical protein
MKRENVAGQGARIMAQGRRSFRRWLGYSSLICLALLFWANLMNLRVRSGYVLMCCFAGLAVIGWGIAPLMDLFRKREGDAIRGAEAEEAVGAILDRLPENHFVLHDVQGPCGNIDHVILRSDGAVFVIETKSMGGRVSERNGRLLINEREPERDYIRQTARNAAWLRDLVGAELGVIPWVDAALVFTKAFVSVRRKVGQVDVMNIRFLDRWLARAAAQCEVARRAAPNWDRIRTALQRPAG